MDHRKKCEAIHSVMARVVCPECGISASIENIVSMSDRINQMQAFIKSMEWVVDHQDKYGRYHCPSCESLQMNGHLKECVLKNILTLV
jgi:predicted RNA-binding Zn-ribbon protein involved in translation (DUF1610 family)